MADFRPATPSDLEGVTRCVRGAYSLYLPRMDREPAPMTADYAALIQDGVVQVLEEDGQLAAVLVLFPKQDHLFVENIAVLPAFQGRGLGVKALAYAEDAARAQSLPEVRFYTNEAMHENVGYYQRRGYQITGRHEEDGFRRIFFAKRV